MASVRFTTLFSWLFLALIGLCITATTAAPFDERRRPNYQPRTNQMPNIPGTPPFNPYGR